MVHRVGCVTDGQAIIHPSRQWGILVLQHCVIGVSIDSQTQSLSSLVGY